MTENRPLADTIRQEVAGRDPPLIVALVSHSGSGKSTLSATLAAELDAVVIETDYFWSGGPDAEWIARTPAERLEQVID